MNKIWAIATLANEEAIIGYTLSHLIAQGVDGIAIMLHNSTDHTYDIVNEVVGRKCLGVIFRESLPSFHQSQMLTRLAGVAQEHGAEWVIPFDGDELHYSEEPGITVCDMIRKFPHEAILVKLLNHYQTDRDISDPNPFKAHPWRHVDINPLGKMIVRFRPDMIIDNGNHRVLYGNGVIPAHPGSISVRHFSAIDADRWVRKSIANATALEADPNIPAGVGAHVRMYKHHADVNGIQSLKNFYMNNFYYRLPNDKLVYDPAPYSGDI